MPSFCESSDGDGWAVWSNDRSSDFSLCFEDSILTFIPDLAVILFALLRISYLLKRPASAKPYATAWHVRTNRALSITAAILSLVALILSITDSNSSPSNTASAAVHLAALSSVVAVLHIEHTRTLRACTGLLLYWMVSALVSSTRVRTWALVGDASVYTAAFVVLAIGLGLTVVQFALECCTRAVDVDGKLQRPVPMGWNVNMFSRITYFYTQSLMALGSKRPLTMEDLWSSTPSAHRRPSSKQQSASLLARFNACWIPEQNRANPSLARSLARAFSPLLIVGAFQALIGVFLVILQPILLDNLITFVSSSSSDPTVVRKGAYVGYSIAAVILVTGIVGAILGVQEWINPMSVGYQMRSALNATIYRKGIRLSPEARQTVTPGKILNHMQGDTNHMMWSMQLLYTPMTGLYELRR
ncbi:hypothetical protein BDK51DRAFT_51871 [Blyttiomyces helicus]|uniref:ABC transmembrane type-1 domain-containing protein n=1 Tax=Blyttiomyces helicus TaxID=388810 RepID=A0A4P9VT88_9FUNG|nr:hypothetical protein BDK51DRAFT_51871 [Blyttiomyces helicus]|eukprot:RKO82721.1 hypothetical protein BDK51DRAFT_51871 [Blyttiomyces helicus]